MNKKSTLGLIAALMVSATAHAVPISVSNGSSFTVNFNGFYNSAPQVIIPGLSSSLTFSGFSFGYSSLFNRTTVDFSYSVSNTSTAPVTASRVSGIGFNLTPNAIDGLTDFVNGEFDSLTLNGNMPNGIGTVEVCFSDQNCAGGASGGPTIGQTDTGSARLVFSGNLSSIQFDNLYARYQSITCSTGSPCSGSASGNTITRTQVPEPATFALLGLGLAGLGLVRRKRSA